VVSDSEAVRALRRQLGRQLAAARQGAGYTQREFARRISYARSTLSTVESGTQRAARAFWEACDEVLGTGGEFARGYDQMRAQRATEQPGASAVAPGRGLRAETLPEALLAYRALGWPVVADGDVAELSTGTVIDALAVPRAAGILAASWWQATNGAADQIRGLPALPHPGHALAAIACAGDFYFLAAAGSFPWAGQDVTDVPLPADTPVIGWHSDGGRIPAPPGIDEDGRPVTWAYLPPDQMQLPSPVLLLDLLGKAIATTSRRPQSLALTHGIQAIPVHLIRPR